LVAAPAGGLSPDSGLLLEQIRVIDKKRIIKVLGSLSDLYLEETSKKLCVILGITSQ